MLHIQTMVYLYITLDMRRLVGPVHDSHMLIVKVTSRNWQCDDRDE